MPERDPLRAALDAAVDALNVVGLRGLNDTEADNRERRARLAKLAIIAFLRSLPEPGIYFDMGALADALEEAAGNA